MGIFSDNVRRYHEFGLVTIPCKDKRPQLGNDWQRFCNEKPTEEQIDGWEKHYHDMNQIGLTLGKATLLSGFDFDYEYNPKSSLSETDFAKDRKNVERQIIALLPPTPCIKTGRKGWTRIYRSHGDLENAQADRNGVRLFDFLARNKQTIIPPSKYSDDGDLVYKWLGSPLEDCLDDIPFITQDHIEEIKFIFGEKVEDNSRHMKIFKFILRQSIIDKDVNVIAKKAVKYDIATNQPAYLSDKKHHARHDAETNALNFAKRIIKWKDSKPKGKGDYDIVKEIKSSREMFFQFFEQTLGTHKRDLLSNRLMRHLEIETAHGTTIRRWSPVANDIPKIRAGALDIGLKREMVEDYLSAYSDFIKPSLLIEIKEWDGIDRFDKILRLVPAVNIVTPGLKGDAYEKAHSMYADIMKDVAAGIFRRTFDSMEQNLFTIIRGGQGVGKNTLIEKVFGQPFSYYSAEVNVGMDMAKNYDAVEGKLVCIIGEFDQTQKVQISFLKELITNASFTARRAYERASDRYELKQTFFSGSNFDDVLKDPSGARRFLILDMPFINYEYVEHCDKEQLVAQYFALYKAGHRMSKESKEWILNFNKGETPENPIDLAVQSYIARIKKDFHMTHDSWLSNTQVEDIISEICSKYAVPQQRFRQTLARRNMSKRSNGTWYANVARDEFGVHLPVQQDKVVGKQLTF